MKPWVIYTWRFPEVEDHPAVVLGTETRLANKPKVNVLLCSSKRAGRVPAEFETLLDEAGWSGMGNPLQVRSGHGKDPHHRDGQSVR
jgi:hypothetical protein